MQIKRFEARDMTEALKMIKQEFGSQAVILSAKTVKKNNGLFGAVRKTGVEITAASDRYQSISNNEQRKSNQKVQLNDEYNDFPNIGEKIGILGTNEREDLQDNHLRSTRIKYNDEDNPIVAKLKLNLEDQGVEGAIVQNIIDQICNIEQEVQFHNIDEIKKVFVDVVSEKIATSKVLDTSDVKTRIIAFVGPTGVGKTTTIAKLGAKYALEKKKSVALLNLDNQRVGSTVTLEKYSKIIGVPYKTVSTVDELQRAIKHFKEMPFIFIDTPGIAVSDNKKIELLAKQLKVISPNDIYLLLSATTKNKDMYRLCDAYSPCQINGIIFTKVDETSCFGNLLNTTQKSKLPLTYFTNGQQIPEHIFSARPETIADLILSATYSGESKTKKIESSDKHSSLFDVKFIHNKDYFIANKNSDIFHHRSCKSVGRINKDNVILFQTKSDARNQNFKPCRMCCYEEVGTDQLLQKFKQRVAISH